MGSSGVVSGLLSVLILASPAFAMGRHRHAPQPPQSQQPEKPVKPKHFLSRLLKESKGALHTLDHDTIVFHYDALPAPDTSYHAPDDPTGLEDANQRILNGVWNPSDSQKVLNFSDWLGYGLYAATDPITSVPYGAPDALATQDGQMPDHDIWRLLEITLTAGMPYFDLTSDISFSKELRDELSRETSCPASSLYGLFLENEYDLVACREPMRELVKATGVGAVLYHWGNLREFVDDLCPAAREAGFYLTAYPLTKDNVRELTAVLPPSGTDPASEERLLIQEVWKKVGMPKERLLWPEIADQTPSEDVQAWVKAKLFGCGQE